MENEEIGRLVAESVICMVTDEFARNPGILANFDVITLFSKAADVLRYTIRKCECIGKDISYIPILFKTELHDYFMRLDINMRGQHLN